MKSSTAIAVAVIAATLILTGVPTRGWAQTKSAGDKPANNLEIVHEKLKADKKLIVSKYLELTELFNRPPSADAASANPFDRLCKPAKTVLLPTDSRLFILSFRKCDKPASVAPRSDGSTR